MAKTRGGVPAAEQSAVLGDYRGTKGMFAPKGKARNTEVGKTGAGSVAPRPKTSKAPLLSASAHTAPKTASMARVKEGGSGDSGQRLPVQSPSANLVGSSQSYGGQGTPPPPRGGPSGLRAGGRNQGWPNGAMYTDSSKKGGSGRGGEFKKSPTRRTKGAAFYGET